MQKQEIKDSVKQSLSWRNYFNPREVEDSIILDNNADLLRRVRVCQAQLDLFYVDCMKTLEGSDQVAIDNLLSTFKKPEINVSKL